MEATNEIETDTDSEMDFDAEERAGTPTEVIVAASEACGALLPIKSKKRYEKVYNDYIKWKATKKADSNSERTVLSYFYEMAEGNKKPTTLWASYSMLKSTLKIYEKTNIETYSTLTAFLKRKSHGYKPKKAKIFTEVQMQQFLDNAPDGLWLDVKAAAVFGICGCCRSHELPTIRMEDIARYDDMYFVTVPAGNTKTAKDNSFAITGPLLDIVRRYESLRPLHATTNRFFLNYQHGKCTVQTIGKHKFYQMPHRIAEYLNLPFPELFTGHSLRSSSTTFYANTGATLEALKRHTGHKSSAVCESYIDESIAYKKRTANMIISSLTSAATVGETSKSSDLAGTATTSTNHSASVFDPVRRPLASLANIRNSTYGTNNTSSSVICNEIRAPSTATTSTIHSASVFDPVRRPLASLANIDNSTDGTKNENSSAVCNENRKSSTITSSPEHSAGVFDPVRHPLTQSSDVAKAPTKSQHRSSHLDTDGVECISQEVNSTEFSTQNIMAEMEKRFAFYKCDNITINFGAPLQKKN